MTWSLTPLTYTSRVDDSFLILNFKVPLDLCLDDELHNPVGCQGGRVDVGDVVGQNVAEQTSSFLNTEVTVEVISEDSD